MPAPSRRKLAAVTAALLAAQKAQPANADVARVVSAFNAWTSEGTLSGTVAKGEELGAALADLFGEAASVVSKAPIPDTLKADAMEEVAEVVRPTPAPTPEPIPEPEEIMWTTPPEHVPSAGDVYSRVDRMATNSAGKQVPIISMWKYMRPEAGGKHRIYDAADSKKEIVISDEDLKSKYSLLETANWWATSMGGRKTRRGRGKKRRTVKRRAKSLRRRRQ
jgi:hypothetical protein